MKILIVGGTGFLGRELTIFFLKKQFLVTILTRQKKNKIKYKIPLVNYIENLDSADNYEIIINLSGQSINTNWSNKNKELIFESRVKTTQKIVDYIYDSKNKPQLFINASAIGYYGNSENKIFIENSQPEQIDFASDLCKKWESIACEVIKSNIRLCILRTGIVMGNEGGVIKQLNPLFKRNLGLQFGEGLNWLSWIHSQDFVRAVDFIIHNERIKGAVNLTAPNPCQYKQFTEALLKAHRRSFFIKIPAFLVRWIFGEMGDTLLLKGQKVIPHKLTQEGFVFDFPMIEGALNDLVNRP